MSLFPQKRGIPKKFMQGQPFNVDNANHNFTVPDGKIWQVLSCVAQRADSSTVSMNRFNKDDQSIGAFSYFAASTGNASGIEEDEDLVSRPFILWEGQYIKVTYGTAQTTGTSYIYLCVIEFDIEELLA